MCFIIVNIQLKEKMNLENLQKFCDIGSRNFL